MNYPKFIIRKSANDQYYFNLWSKGQEILLKSEMYTSKQNCKNGIESVRVNSQEDKNYEKRTSENSKHYFNLKSPANGQIIGTSNMYETASARDNAINETKRDAPIAPTEDLS